MHRLCLYVTECIHLWAWVCSHVTELTMALATVTLAYVVMATVVLAIMALAT